MGSDCKNRQWFVNEFKLYWCPVWVGPNGYIHKKEHVGPESQRDQALGTSEALGTVDVANGADYWEEGLYRIYAFSFLSIFLKALGNGTNFDTKVYFLFFPLFQLG